VHVGILERVDGQPLELLVGSFTASPVPKVVVSLVEGEVGRFVAVNRAFSDLVGYDHHELIGQSSQIVVAAEDRAVVGELFDGMVRGVIRDAVIERVLVRRDGSRVWISSRNFLGHDRTGRPFLIAEVVDSSSRQALADSEAWFRSLVDASPIGMAVLGGDGRWVRTNPAVPALLGYTTEELAALTLSAVTHPEDRADDATAPDDLASDAGRQVARRLLRKDGQVVHCLVTVTVLTAESGVPAQFLAQIVDVTAGQRSQDLLDVMITASPDLLALTTLDGTVLRVNAAWERLLGWTGDELIGTNLAALRHPGETATAGGPGEATLRYRARDGGYRWVHWSGTVVADQQVIVATGRDVTDAVRAERSAAREADRLRTTIRVQREITAVAADRGKVLRLIADRTLEVISTGEAASVHLTDPDEQAVRMVAASGGLAGRDVPAIALTGTILGATVSSGLAVRCDDTATDPRASNTLSRTVGMRSLVAAPLLAPNGTAFGALVVGSTRVAAFDEGDEQQLVLLADTLSSALRHADDAAHTARALADLAVSENRFRLTFDNSPVGLTLASVRPDDLGRYLHANAAMSAITGYSTEELTRMTYADLQHPDDAGTTAGFVRRLRDGEIDTLRTELRYLHRHGHTIWVSIRVAVVRDEDGKARYVINQVEDVTARRAAESELRRQARLLELIPAAVIVRDLSGEIRWWNAGATALYGWPLTAATGKAVDRLLATTFPGHETAAGQRGHLEREGSWEGQLQHVTADGRTLTVLSCQVLHQPEPGSDGHREPPQVLEINTDVTAARAAEVALADSEQRMRAQFDNSAAGQVIRALDGTLIAVNPAFARMLGYTVGELTGTSESALLDPADHHDYQRLTAGLFAGEADWYTREGRLRHAAGHWVDTEATISLVRGDNGRPKHLIGVVTDISGRRAAERARDNAAAALAERNTELEAANQLKLDIIGMLGHEIGNPLTTIQGQAEILADDWAGLDDQRRTRAIDAIGRQAGRLDTIVREVLAMVTIDAGSIRADRRELSIREEVARALDDELVPVYGEDVRVLFSPGHLQQILVNLLSNAAKYGGGATAVHIARSERLVHVTVEDDGPGVPEQFRDRLFDRLTRAERDATTVKGTGLGLYIVRGLARANHGDVHHEPNPTGGSRFIVDLEPAPPGRGGGGGSS
jgi:PAS domain S-box-containing protein